MGKPTSVRLSSKRYSSVISKPNVSEKKSDPGSVSVLGVQSVMPQEKPSDPRYVIVEPLSIISVESLNDTPVDRDEDEDGDDEPRPRAPPAKKNRLIIVVCFTLLALTFAGCLAGGLYLLITKTRPFEESTDGDTSWFVEEETDPVGVVTTTSLCQRAFPQNRHCVTEVQGTAEQRCKGVDQCRVLRWTVSESGGFVTLDDRTLSLANTNRAHCSRNKWCQKNRCVNIPHNVVSRYRHKPYLNKPVHHENGVWVKDYDGRKCFSDEAGRIKNSKLFQACGLCRDYSPYAFRLELRQCDLTPNSTSGMRKTACDGPILVARWCVECEKYILPNQTYYDEMCANLSSSKEAQAMNANGTDCSYLCTVLTERALWKPDGVECVVKDRKADGVCVSGLCIPWWED